MLVPSGHSRPLGMTATARHANPGSVDSALLPCGELRSTREDSGSLFRKRRPKLDDESWPTLGLFLFPCGGGVVHLHARAVAKGAQDLVAAGDDFVAGLEPI